MPTMLQARPESEARVRSTEPRLLLDVYTTQNACVVHVSGELDLATRNQLVSAATAGHHPNTLIDLAGVTFMDCSGYRALIAARRIVEGEGRSLTITGESGEPARFLALIDELEQCPLRRA